MPYLSSRFIRRCLGLMLLVFALVSPQRAAAEEGGTQPPRERLSLNKGWRFHKGDPDAAAAKLIYDVRPKVTDTRDDIAADSMPREAERLARDGTPVLKPWILPSGNAFLADPTRRHVRPAGNPGEGVACLSLAYDDSGWRRLDLPHDWAVEGPFLAEGDFGGMGRLPSWGVAWYRRTIDIPASDAGRRVFLEVDGAMSYAMVWLNGKLVGGWPYGYSSWQLDLTPWLVVGGPNQLAIRLDNPPSSSRWYPGGGIYRNVWLTKTSPLHVSHWGVQVRTPEVSSNSATVELRVSLENAGRAGAGVVVGAALYELDAGGRKAAEPVARFRAAPLELGAGDRSTVRLSTELAQPRLWGPPPAQTPHRYAAVVSLEQDGRLVDLHETPFGIRSLRFDASAGLFVNGERIALRGVNQHHDLGALGAAFNVRAAERQLEVLREFGCNAVRMSHNPPAPELLELTDRLGFLVINEAFDCWERKKTPLDFHLIYPDWHEQDLRALLRRDRNHPSVIAWSVGNEVGEQYTGEAGALVARRLVDIVHEEDPGRPATCAMNFAKPDMPLPAELDLISLNYQGEGIRYTDEFVGTDRIRTAPQYDAYRAKFPGKPILSSETASAFSNRGVYLFPVSRETSAPVRDGRGGDSVNHLVTGYELHAVDFGSSAEKVFSSLERHPFVAGEFVWTGWDHLGEPTPYYSSRGSYCGIVDMAGFRKDRFYLYQSHWRPELPMAHLLPHWTWPERVGQVTPVHVFTSGDEAELFLNGRSLGRKRKGPLEYRLRWDEVVYEPGTLEVVAYRKGERWATDAVSTAGPAARLELRADREAFAADGVDMSFVTVTVVDEAGRLVPRSENALQFEVEGAADFVASDNGDPRNFEPFQAPSRRAFNGLCLVMLRSREGQSGEVVLRVRSEGMPVATLRLATLPQGAPAPGAAP